MTDTPGGPPAPAATEQLPASPPVETPSRWYADSPKTDDAAPTPGNDVTEPQQLSGAPERYDLALDGVELDRAMLSEAEPILRELNLSSAGANKLLPIATKMMTGAQERTVQAMIDAGGKQKKAWLDAYVADPEIGGGRRKETEQLADRGMTALGFKPGHPFRAMLTESGLGNHPDMIRTFRRLGELTSVDGYVPRPGAAQQTSTDQRWYGKGGK